MTALISKPGITNASTLSIPKTWSASWFASFISSQLTGADVRNAIGVDGISVSGNLTSPYATIGLTAGYGTDGYVYTAQGPNVNPIWAPAAGGSSLTVTDGASTVTGVTQITFSGAAVSGSTPDATVTISGGGGGGWTQNVNQSGASLTGFTTAAGTWTVTGSAITSNNSANNTAAAQWGVYYSAVSVPTALSITKVTFNIAAWNVANTSSRVGVYICGAYTGSLPQENGFVICFQWASASTVNIAWLTPAHSVGVIGSTIAFSPDTNYTLEVVKAGYNMEVYVNGTLVGTAMSSTMYSAFELVVGDGPQYVGLFNSGAEVSFTNLEQWSQTLL